MSKFSTTITFSNADQVTSSKLNEIVSGLQAESDLVVGTTLQVVGGQLKVGTITSSEMGALSIATGSLQDASVTTAKMAEGVVTFEKLANGAVGGLKIAFGGVNFSALSAGNFSSQAQMEAQDSSSIVKPSAAKYSPSAVKAYGAFPISSSSRSIRSNSYNFGSVSRISSTQTQVTFSEDMVGSNYVAIVSLETDGTETGEVAAYDRQSNGFKIKHPSESSGRAINFSVFGKLATA